VRFIQHSSHIDSEEDSSGTEDEESDEEDEEDDEGDQGTSSEDEDALEKLQKRFGVEPTNKKPVKVSFVQSTCTLYYPPPTLRAHPSMRQPQRKKQMNLALKSPHQKKSRHR